LAEKRESWRCAFERGNLSIHISTHGRFKIFKGDELVETLSFFDSVSLLKDLSEDYEQVMCAIYKDVV
jgi:hypothetical protein